MSKKKSIDASFEKKSTINEFYVFFDKFTNTFLENVIFYLELNRSPHRITFETDDVLIYLENSWLVDTFDFFLIDENRNLSISESGLKLEDFTKIKNEIKKSLKIYTKNQACLLIKEKQNQTFNKINKLKKKVHKNKKGSFFNVRKRNKK